MRRGDFYRYYIQAKAYGGGLFVIKVNHFHLTPLSFLELSTILHVAFDEYGEKRNFAALVGHSEVRVEF